MELPLFLTSSERSTYGNTLTGQSTPNANSEEQVIDNNNTASSNTDGASSLNASPQTKEKEVETARKGKKKKSTA